MRGLRCQVCTGCGLCPGVIGAGRSGAAGGMHILAGEAAGGAKLDLRNERGLRLASADIGTTTIAMELYGEDGRTRDTHVTVNPQVKYGSDVLSRIAAASDPEVRKDLQSLVKSALAQGVKRFLKCLDKDERLVMVIAANTTMSYLLMGWDPAELGRAPFHASKLEGAFFDLEPEDSEQISVSCLLLPGISAFGGGDVFAGIHACKMAEKEELTLLIDLGTNGEMALGNREKLLATATAAGPAFEGGASRGIWGADMVRFVAELRQEGLLDESGLLAEPYFTKGIRIGNVMVTKEAIRSFQVAKAAIAAGIRILTEEYGIALTDIQQVVLAGGFGYYLRPEDAARIGMLPKELEKKTVSGGNTALLGAKLLGASLLRETDFCPERFGEFLRDGRIGRYLQAETLNLAQHPRFQDYYVNAMELCERNGK